MRVCDTLSPTRHYLAGACFSLHPAPCILYPVSSFDEDPILRRVFPLSAEMGWGCTLPPRPSLSFFVSSVQPNSHGGPMPLDPFLFLLFFPPEKWTPWVPVG